MYVSLQEMQKWMWSVAITDKSLNIAYERKKVYVANYK